MTGLLYVAIVALWAAVLIPMWLRRHDDDQARRIERHRTAMGALARMPEGSDRAASARAARRRVIVSGALAGLVVATAAAWALGYASGWLVTGSGLVLVAYVGGVFLASRMRLRDSSQRALQRSSTARVGRERQQIQPVPSVSESEPVRAPIAAPQSSQWDEVFDQTA